MSLSELISGALQPVLDLLPQVHARPASNEWGVADSWLGGVKTFSGPYLHIPATTHCELYPKCEVPVDTGLQTLTTADRKTVAVNATAIIRITDPVYLRSSVAEDSWEEWLAMRVRGCVQEVVTGHNWSYTLDKGESFIEELAYSELHSFGIELERLVLEDITECIPLRLLNPYGA
tara:strand:- start:12 stop:539 length:528 start_codon:yes stop_codon:yes gene_type:complete